MRSVDRIIVLIMHGTPPNDFGRADRAEFFELQSRIRRAPESAREPLVRRHAELEAQMRCWPRTSANDPYWAASLELGEALAAVAHCEVIVAFNEFCGPSVQQAIDAAVLKHPQQVVVTTTMLTRGGAHAEKEIPEIIESARQRHPEASIDYAWPFRSVEVAAFLARQIVEVTARGKRS